MVLHSNGSLLHLFLPLQPITLLKSESTEKQNANSLYMKLLFLKVMQLVSFSFSGILTQSRQTQHTCIADNSSEGTHWQYLLPILCCALQDTNL